MTRRLRRTEKRNRELMTFCREIRSSDADDLAVVMIAPGSQKPDAAFWAFVKEQSLSDDLPWNRMPACW